MTRVLGGENWTYNKKPRHRWRGFDFAASGGARGQADS
jgi:hypothetical protein